MFKFFVLSNSGSGEARRHFPFRSIIHKHVLPLFFVLVVLLFSSVPVSVHALADPVFQPVYDTQFYQLPQTFSGLSGPQQDIFYFVLGNDLISYAGLSEYQIENPYSDPDELGDWIKKLGYDLYNDVIESFSIAGAPIISAYKYSKELFGNIIGAMNFAGSFNNSSWQDFYTDVQTNGLDLQLYPSMFGALNQYFAQFGGLYDWQFSTSPFVADFSWNYVSLSGANESDYNQFVSDLSLPRAFANTSLSYVYNTVFASPVKFDLFLNTTNNTISLLNYSGVSYNAVSYFYLSGYYNKVVSYSGELSSYAFSFNPSQYTYAEAMQYALNNFAFVKGYKSVRVGNYNVGFDLLPNINDFINKIYIGPSVSEKVEFINSNDLNFGDPDSNSYLSPSDQVLLDIKGLLQDLLEQNDLRAPVLDNMSNIDGSPVTVQQLQPVSVALDLPDSGIDIPTNIFGGFFNSNDGFISYLWYMTKPLVVYTHDLLDCFWFGPDGGFDWSGPAPIVFGVISLGLIGGLIVKMLL